MKIDNLLDVNVRALDLIWSNSKVKGRIIDISDDIFVFEPESPLEILAGAIVKISDGNDTILAKVLESSRHGLKMCTECYVVPAKERREDVRINDRIYYQITFLCHANEKPSMLSDALQRIQANKLIIDSFLKGKYGYPGIDEIPYTSEAPFNQALWEINRKLDLLIHMFLADEFRDLMKKKPKDVNISASGIRLISSESFEAGDLVELSMILPMVPLLFIKLVAEVIRVKPITSYETHRWALAARFIKLDPDTKDDIIRFLFRRQREMLRKRNM